jgi:hypothetical protein
MTMSDFNPVKTPIADYPHPVGTIMRSSMGSLWVVVDRDGLTFRACCLQHEKQGVASGYWIQSEDGRVLDRSEPAPEVDSYDCPNVPGQLFT